MNQVINFSLFNKNGTEAHNALEHTDFIGNGILNKKVFPIMYSSSHLQYITNFYCEAYFGKKN